MHTNRAACGSCNAPALCDDGQRLAALAQLHALEALLTHTHSLCAAAGGNGSLSSSTAAWSLHHQHSQQTNGPAQHLPAGALPPRFSASLRSSSGGSGLTDRMAALAAAGQWGGAAPGAVPQLSGSLSSFPSSAVSSPYHPSARQLGALLPAVSLQQLHLLNALGAPQAPRDLLSPAASACSSAAAAPGVYSTGIPYEAALLAQLAASGAPHGAECPPAGPWPHVVAQVPSAHRQREPPGDAAFAAGAGAGAGTAAHSQQGSGAPCFVAQVTELLSSTPPGLGPVLAELKDMVASAATGPGGAAAVDAATFVGLLQEAAATALAAAADAAAPAAARGGGPGWGGASGGAGSGNAVDGRQLAPVRTRAATDGGGGDGGGGGTQPPGTPIVQMHPQELAAARAALLRLMCAAHAMVSSPDFARLCASVGPVCDLYDAMHDSPVVVKRRKSREMAALRDRVMQDPAFVKVRGAGRRGAGGACAWCIWLACKA